MPPPLRGRRCRPLAFAALRWAATVVVLTAAQAEAGLAAARLASSASASSGTMLACDAELSGPICLGNQQVLLPPALQPGVVGHWSFDKAAAGFPGAFDLSGHGSHGAPQPPAGPALSGQGSSAFFRRSFMTVPAGGNNLFLRDFTYTFWIHLLDGGGPGSLQFCPLVRKGVVPDEKGQHYGASPAILVDWSTHALRVELLTETSDDVTSSTIEAFDSNARLMRGRWYHVAVVRLDKDRLTRLYVNGILDSEQASRGFTKPNREPLYVGGDPLSTQSCDVPLYLDELKAYSRAVSADELQAEAAPALAGVEPAFVRLACMECPLEVAVANCPEGYHVCSSLDLHLGAYQVVHALGWLRKGTSIWTHAPPAPSPVPAPAAPLAPGPFPAPPVYSTSPDPMAAVAELAGLPFSAAAAVHSPHDGPPQGGLGLGVCCSDD